MTALVLVCVMGAAFLHAGWNAVLRAGEDRLWSMTLMMLAVIIITVIAVPMVGLPEVGSWPYVAASALVHVFYNLSLVRTYRSGDLGQTYPISRGSSPVLVTLGALVFAHESLSLAAYIGIGLISIGIISLAFGRGKPKLDIVAAAFATGVLIGAYTVLDGIGVRFSTSSLAYTNSMFLLWSITMPFIFWVLRGRPPAYTRAQTATALAGGLVSMVAYGIVIWAMQHEAMGVVSALRETSVVWATIIGRLFLGERLTLHRVLSCSAIAAGAACLAA